MLSVVCAVRYATLFLSDLDTPKLEAEVLLSAVLSEERVFLRTHSRRRLSFYETLKYGWWVLQRRRRFPVAQIVGFKDWGNMRLDIDKNVLIPRDETEIFCSKIVFAHRTFMPLSVLDIGTGSGAIAIYLSLNFTRASFTALDISSKSLMVARKNAQQYSPALKLLRSDLLSALPDKCVFDILVANLPYLPQAMKLSKEVQKDPALALFSGEDGLDHYRQLARELKRKKVFFRELWIEFLPFQALEIKNIFKDWQVDLLEDLSGDVYFAQIQNR